VRQLRQVRNEQEQKIQEAVVKKTREWESTKAELETKLSNVHASFKQPRVKLLQLYVLISPLSLMLLKKRMWPSKPKSFLCWRS